MGIMDINSEDVLRSLEQTQRAPHQIEIEFHCLITTNHRLLLDAIAKIENEELAGIKDEDEYREQQKYFDDLRIAANNFAIVALVTRLDHWVTVYCKKLKLSLKATIPEKMQNLNKKLVAKHAPTDFFKGLVTARDSVIHGDSRGEWDHKGEKRTIPPQYGGFQLAVSEEQVTEAVEKTLKQIIWYEEHIR
jgi:hypothetical protein